MKRILNWVIIFTVLFSVSSCAQKEEAAPASQAPIEEAPPPAQAPIEEMPPVKQP